VQTWIALLKGVNVGGRNKLPMKALAESLGKSGLMGVKTYIQSGNIIFSSDEKNTVVLTEKIKNVINANFKCDPPVVLLALEELSRDIEINPFAQLVKSGEEKTLHLFFLSAKPVSIDQDRLETTRLPTERGKLEGTVFYLLAPEGFGNSKLASQVEKIFGVTATARNWSTVCAIMRLAQN